MNRAQTADLARAMVSRFYVRPSGEGGGERGGAVGQGLGFERTLHNDDITLPRIKSTKNVI